MAAEPAAPTSTGDPTSTGELHYPPGSLVVLAGLPGAGKSTLLRRLYDLRGDETAPVPAGGALVIDTYQARNRWARFLRPLPSRLHTPVVYATHVWRISRAIGAGHAVVAHSRGTWPHILHGFAWLAHRAGATMHLILLDVEPRTAWAGQHDRGRVVSAAIFVRHCRRWRDLVRQARAGAVPPADGVTLLDRPAAGLLRAIRFDGNRRSGVAPWSGA
ncbi:AAA family ATPase [Spongiactinospora sp. TRM90649]|uniref:AAA family ATPase n=1 Tax=Spongiactinospora sp. TRM90649 TaxID=3031114 RepID=UPI0023F9970A|nr:AAA family ATPase [Spongiactinospora sp. TRM90649]MDF5759147.1 AAA family ATPase [Spongiactinospora sp. TRM90649]